MEAKKQGSTKLKVVFFRDAGERFFTFGDRGDRDLIKLVLGVRGI